MSCITFFLGLAASHSLKDPPSTAASHSSKDPPSLAYWLFASPQLISVRWCCRGRAKRENTGSKEEPLLTPLYGELHLHTFPHICWRSSERRKVRVVVDRPRLCRASSVDANVEGLKNSNTHQRIAKAIFFSFVASSQELWSLKKLPFTIFVVHATTWKWLSLDSRRLCGFQWSCHATCKQRRVWPGAGGQQLDRFRRKFFFFLYFRKKLRARATGNKENNNSGLMGKSAMSNLA